MLHPSSSRVQGCVGNVQLCAEDEGDALGQAQPLAKTLIAYSSSNI